MIWLGWRQQRAETLITAGILAALAALLIPTGLSMASAYDHAGLAHCLGNGEGGRACGNAIDSFFSSFGNLGGLVDWVTILPGVIGVLLAAPLVMQLEQRTYRLDWTQSITRGRWLAGKLGLAVATALFAALALTLLLTWWRTPFVHLQGRLVNSVYDSEGTVVAAYTLFGLGLGLAVGAVWRRAVPAMVTAFATYFAARLFVDTWLRQRLVSPLTATWNGRGGGPDLSRAWVLSEHPVDAHGHALKFMTCSGGGCAVPIPKHGISYVQASYHPAGHFWPLQLAETAIFAGAAVGLIAFAAWWTLRRD